MWYICRWHNRLFKYWIHISMYIICIIPKHCKINPFVPIEYVGYILGSRDIKRGMTLYHIGYVKVSKTLVVPNTIGVIGCGQVVWYWIGITVWPILGFMAWFLNTDTWGNIVVVVGNTNWWTFITSAFNNYFSLSSTKGQWLNICPTCWQYE